MQPDHAIRAAFNTGGHPAEWTINIPGYNHERYIPVAIERQLSDLLGSEFYVCNRGSRLEITSRVFDGGRNPAEFHVVPALEKLELGPVSVDVVPYVAPTPRLHACTCGCGQQLTMREVLEHVRASKAKTAVAV